MSWETVKLGDVTAVSRGTTITKKQTVDGNIPVIGGGIKPTYFHNKFNRDAGVITISGLCQRRICKLLGRTNLCLRLFNSSPLDKSYETKFLYSFIIHSSLSSKTSDLVLHNHTSMQRILRRWISLKLISQCKTSC